jgi:hypothetical protein
MAAEPERLAKGEPALSREAMLDHRTPQDQHIPEYSRRVAALRGMASGALIAGVPQGWTQGDAPCRIQLPVSFPNR